MTLFRSLLVLQVGLRFLIGLIIGVLPSSPEDDVPFGELILTVQNNFLHPFMVCVVVPLSSI